MRVSRRFILKGMALSSMTGLALGTRAQMLAGFTMKPSSLQNLPSLALVGGGAAEHCFLQGLRKCSGGHVPVQRVGNDLGFMRLWAGWLQDGTPKRIIGLLDDASATLALDLARSSGARIHWLGHHAIDAGGTRHRLQATGLSQGCARQLSEALKTCGSKFTLSEERQNSTEPCKILERSPGICDYSARWIASLAYSLAAIGNQHAAASSFISVPIPAPVTGSPITGSFVSFSIET